MQIRKWSYQRFWGGRSSQETPVVLFVGGDVSQESERVLSILESSLETDVYRSDNARLVEEGELQPDAALRKLIARSRAPVMVFGLPEETPAGALSALTERFHPARAQWWYEDYRRYLRDASARVTSTMARNRLSHLLSSKAEIADQLLPPELLTLARDASNQQDQTVLALLWYVRHARFRDARLHDNRNVHLYGGEQLRLTPKETLEEVLQASGIGVEVLEKLRFETESKNAQPSEIGLPGALGEACAELLAWLNRNASR